MQSSSENPSPFRYPLLQLVHYGPDATPMVPGTTYTLVDVDGQIAKYIEEDGRMTPLLKQLLEMLAAAGITVQYYSTYNGSGGPNFLLRNGALFERALRIEKPSDEVAVSMQVPSYVKNA